MWVGSGGKQWHMYYYLGRGGVVHSMWLVEIKQNTCSLDSRFIHLFKCNVFAVSEHYSVPCKLSIGIIFSEYDSFSLSSLLFFFSFFFICNYLYLFICNYLYLIYLSYLQLSLSYLTTFLFCFILFPFYAFFSSNLSLLICVCFFFFLRFLTPFGLALQHSFSMLSCTWYMKIKQYPPGISY